MDTKLVETFNLDLAGESFFKEQKKAYRLTLAIYMLSYLYPLSVMYTEGLSAQGLFTIIFFVLLSNYIFIYRIIHKLYGRNNLVVTELKINDDHLQFYLYNGEESFMFLKVNWMFVGVKMQNIMVSLSFIQWP